MQWWGGDTTVSPLAHTSLCSRLVMFLTGRSRGFRSTEANIQSTYWSTTQPSRHSPWNLFETRFPPRTIRTRPGFSPSTGWIPGYLLLGSWRGSPAFSLSVVMLVEAKITRVRAASFRPRIPPPVVSIPYNSFAEFRWIRPVCVNLIKAHQFRLVYWKIGRRNDLTGLQRLRAPHNTEP